MSKIQKAKRKTAREVRKTVVLSKGLAAEIERYYGTPNNPLNWSRHLQHVVEEAFKREQRRRKA